MATSPLSNSPKEQIQDTSSQGITPRVSLEKVGPALSSGCLSQGGKLFIFTLQEIKDDGPCLNLSMNFSTMRKVQDALIRFLEANQLGQRESKGHYLGTEGIDEFTIALDQQKADPIELKTAQGPNVPLGNEMLTFLKGSNPKSYNFLLDLQKTALSSSYQSSYFDLLPEEEKTQRVNSLKKLNEQFTVYDTIASNLRSSKYAHYDDLIHSKQSLWIQKGTLHPLIDQVAQLTSTDSHKNIVLDPLNLSEPSQKDLIEKLKGLQSSDIASISLPIYTFRQDGSISGTYGLYIDQTNRHMYFYNPSKVALKETSALNQFLTKLGIACNYTRDTKITSTEKHMGLQPWEPIRYLKHHLKDIDQRSPEEEKALTHILDTYNSGRYVLKFFDELLKADHKEKAYQNFISSKIRREEIENYCDELAENLLRSYHSRYSTIYSGLS